MYESITIKEHDSLSIVCTYTEDDGSPTDMTGIEIQADIRSLSGNFITSLTSEYTDIRKGKFTITSDKEDMFRGKYLIDILFSLGDERVASDTFHLIVLPSITTPRGI